MTASADFAVLTKVFLVSPSKIKCGRGVLFLKFGQRWVMKKLFRNMGGGGGGGGVWEGGGGGGGGGGGVLVEREEWFRIFHHFSLRKTCALLMEYCFFFLFWSGKYSPLL